MKFRLWFAVLSALTACHLSVLAKDGIPVNWTSTGGITEPNDQVNVVLPDGAGNLYIGGRFTAVGKTLAFHVAKWNGTEWSALATPDSQLGEDNDYAVSDVHALALGPDGSLYVGASGITLNGIKNRCLLKWDGSSWTDLSGPSVTPSSSAGLVYDLFFWNNSLVVSGNFTQMGGISASNIALWDGVQWSDLGGGMNGTVFSCASLNGQLYAGGDFSLAGSASAKNIARWNGSAWSAFGTSCDGQVNDIKVNGNELIAVGRFRFINGSTCNGIARFNETTWSTFGNGFGSYNQVPAMPDTDGIAAGEVKKVEVYNGMVHAIGWRYTTGSQSSGRHGLYRWSGTDWILLSRGNLIDIATSGQQLHVGGGLIFDIDGGTILARNLVTWTGTVWQKIGDGLDNRSTPPSVKAIMKVGSDLYVGGGFTRIGSTAANSVARWDGTAWHPLGNGVNGTVESIVATDSDIYVAGVISQAGGQEVQHIARWDGHAWHNAGNGVPGKVSLLYAKNNHVFAAGSRDTLSTTPDTLLKWDGNAWIPLISLSGPIKAMVADDTSLYVGGDFKTNWLGFPADSSGLFRLEIATNKRWPLGTSVRGSAVGLDFFEGNLYAVGIHVPGVTFARAMKWDGVVWSPLGRGYLGEGTKIKNIAGLLVVVNKGPFTRSPNEAYMWNGISWVDTKWTIHGDVSDMLFADDRVALCGDIYGVDDIFSAGIVVGEILPPELPNVDITQHPASHTIPIGATAQMRVAATGEDLLYQWYQGVSGDTSTPITGATSTTFTTQTHTHAGNFSYWVRVSLASKYADSQTALVSVTATALAPNFPVQPQSQIVQIGESLMFNPITAGSTMIAYQWQKNLVNLSTAKQSSLSISNVTTLNAGAYRLLATNSVGSTTSSTAYLTVVTPLPSRVDLTPYRELNLRVAALLPTGTTAQYLWFRDGVSLGGNVNFIGATTSNLVCPSIGFHDDGQYTCRLTLLTAYGSVTRMLPGTLVTILPKPILSLIGSMHHMINESVSVQVFAYSLEPPKYEASGLPPGLAINPITGVITGKPTRVRLVSGIVAAYKTRITATNVSGTSEVMYVDWTIHLLSNQYSGSFQGVLGHVGFTESIIPANIGLEDRLGGLLNCTLTSSGAFSGSLLLGRQRLSFASKFPLVYGSGIEAQVEIKRKAPLPNVILSIYGGPYYGEGLLSVTLSIGTGSGYGAVYVQGKNPAWPTGRRHCALGETLPSTDPPTGYGYCVVTLSATGGLIWAGRLPDNTIIAGSSQMRADGISDFYQCLYTGLGSIVAQIDMSYEDSIGSILWYKAPQPNTRNFPGGVSLRFLELTGKRYVKPPSGQSVFGPVLVPKTTPNSALFFSEGGLSTPITQLLHMSNSHSVTLFANSDSVKMTFDVNTGLFSGSFTQPGPLPTIKRSASYFGLWIPNLGSGIGFFQLPEMPNASGETINNTPLQSGPVLLINSTVQAD